MKLLSVEVDGAFPNPPKIICIGMNDREHRSEIGRAPSRKPPLFGRFSNAGRRIPSDQVWQHLAGDAPRHGEKPPPRLPPQARGPGGAHRQHQ